VPTLPLSTWKVSDWSKWMCRGGDWGGAVRGSGGGGVGFDGWRWGLSSGGGVPAGGLCRFCRAGACGCRLRASRRLKWYVRRAFT